MEHEGDIFKKKDERSVSGMVFLDHIIKREGQFQKQYS
jgi:hypothetical protein